MNPCGDEAPGAYQGNEQTRCRAGATNASHPGIERDGTAYDEPQIRVALPDPSDTRNERSENETIDQSDSDLTYPHVEHVVGLHEPQRQLPHADRDRLIAGAPAHIGVPSPGPVYRGGTSSSKCG